MILKLSDKTTINLLQACFWYVADKDEPPFKDGRAISLIIVFAGDARCYLDANEAEYFNKALEQMAQPNRVQLTGGIVAPY
ncbi:MAG TPA: hypothetical protein VGB07_36250 [Blastocatellia bacterium]